MKKRKLITAITSLGTIATATPIVATSCSSNQEGKLELTVSGTTTIELNDTTKLTVTGKYDGKDVTIKNVVTDPSQSEFIQITINEDKTISIKGLKVTTAPVSLKITATDNENHTAETTINITVTAIAIAKSEVTSTPTPITDQTVDRFDTLANVATLECKFFDKNDNEMSGAVKWVVDVTPTTTGVTSKPTVTVDNDNKIQIDATNINISANATYDVEIKGEEQSQTFTNVGSVKFTLKVNYVAELTDIKYKNRQGDYEDFVTELTGLEYGDEVSYYNENFKAKVGEQEQTTNFTAKLSCKVPGEVEIDPEMMTGDTAAKLLATNKDVVLILHLKYSSGDTKAVKIIEITCKDVQDKIEVEQTLTWVPRQEGTYLSLVKNGEDISDQVTFDFDGEAPSNFEFDPTNSRWLMVKADAQLTYQEENVDIIATPKTQGAFDPIKATVGIAAMDAVTTYSFKMYGTWDNHIQTGQSLPLALYNNSQIVTTQGGNVISDFAITSQTNLTASITEGRYENNTLGFATVDSWDDQQTSGTIKASVKINNRSIESDEITLQKANVIYSTSPAAESIIELKGTTAQTVQLLLDGEKPGTPMNCIWQTGNFLTEGELANKITYTNDMLNSQFTMKLNGFTGTTTEPSTAYVYAKCKDSEATSNYKLIMFSFNVTGTDQ